MTQQHMTLQMVATFGMGLWVKLAYCPPKLLDGLISWLAMPTRFLWPHISTYLQVSFGTFIAPGAQRLLV